MEQVEKFNQIIDEVYEQYWNSVETSEYDGFGPTLIKLPTLSKEQFINKCKTDNEFSQEWGLHIKERVLSLEERMNEFLKLGISPSEFRKGGNYGTVIPKERTLEVFDTNNIPTKVITLTYNNETIECYEN